MRQRNITGYPLIVQPPDGSHRDPFELAAGESTDYPDPIAGCAADDGVISTEPPAEPDPPTKTTKTTKASAAPADGGDTK